MEKIFDRRLARAHQRRALPTRPAFLGDLLAASIADRLAEVLRDFETVLVHGFGSTTIAATLRGNPRIGRIIAASSVLEPGIDLVFEAETVPLAPQSISAIVSVLTLQSVNDLPGALVQMRRALHPDGMLLACLFAEATLNELRRTWLAAESEVTGGASPRVAPFADLRELSGLLQRAGFALPVADTDRTTLRYTDGLALMREIKALGFGHALAARARRPVTSALLAAATSLYDRDHRDADGKVRATVDIAWLTGWAPHESQQQPLRPGTARSRLADALNTAEHPLKRE